MEDLTFVDVPNDELSQFFQKLLIASTYYGSDSDTRHNIYLPYSFYNKYIVNNTRYSSFRFCGYYDGVFYFYYLKSNVYYFITYNSSTNIVNNVYWSQSKFDNYVNTFNPLLVDYYRGGVWSNSCYSASSSTMVNYVKLGTSYLDDFMYSNRSSEIFITSLYFVIPIILFVIGIKVFRKGLFK